MYRLVLFGNLLDHLFDNPVNLYLVTSSLYKLLIHSHLTIYQEWIVFYK